MFSFLFSFMGPAEVAAWSLLGDLWDILEDITEAIADAAEVRTSYLLGAGQPAQAKLSSYKSIHLAIFAAFLFTSLIFIGGEDIPTWLTKDPTLQRMVAELIPLFGIANIALTIGTMAWTLVGCQNRYVLATAVGHVGTWFVTIPLGALFTYMIEINLQGLTAAIVIGYMVSGTINTLLLFQTDWPKMSRRVIADNEDSSSSSSSPSSSSSSISSSSSASISSSSSPGKEGRGMAQSGASSAKDSPRGGDATATSPSWSAQGKFCCSSCVILNTYAKRISPCEMELTKKTLSILSRCQNLWETLLIGCADQL